MNDAELIKQILNGNMSAFSYLVSIHQKLVLHIVRRMVLSDDEAADICQDVFVKVYQKLGEFRGQSKLSTWIASVAYHHAINHLRKRKRLQEVSMDDSPTLEREVGAKIDDDCSFTLDEDTRQLLLRKVEELPQHYRVVLTLFYLEEFSYKEIEEVTGMPEGTVKSYLARARNMLREKLTFAKEEIWG